MFQPGFLADQLLMKGNGFIKLIQWQTAPNQDVQNLHGVYSVTIWTL